MEDDKLTEFKAVLTAILEMLKRGEIQRAIDYIEQILK